MAITNARILIRRGNEVDFDANNMQPGEWALSTDEKIVRICVAPGVCIRMATYDAFETDMAKIEAILEQAKSIKEAVTLINTEVSENAKAVAEYTEQAKQYRDEAEQFRNEAEAFAPEGYSELVQNVEENTVKIETILEKGGLTFDSSASGEDIHLTDSTDNNVKAFALYGKATQDGTPTPDAPVEIEVAGASGSVEVKSVGKNKLNNTATSQTVNGGTVTVNEDKSVTVNGTFTATTNIEIISDSVVLEKSGLLSGCPSGGSANTYNIQARNNTTSKWVNNYGGDTELTVGEYNRVILQIASGYTANNLVFKPMISFEGGEYQPYKETTATIPTPNGLAGIPVDSDGNYTDKNGQQWICDSIVKYADGSGKRVQRIGKAVLNGTEGVYRLASFGYGIISKNVDRSIFPGIKKAGNINVPLMSNIRVWKKNRSWTVGSFGVELYSFWFEDTGNVLFPTIDDWNNYLTTTNMHVLYPLEEPIITDLTAEQIAEIEKLYTFYPVTNISNDAECGMSITYMADAKNYIDNRLALIESAMLNNI